MKTPFHAYYNVYIHRKQPTSADQSDPPPLHTAVRTSTVKITISRDEPAVMAVTDQPFSLQPVAPINLPEEILIDQTIAEPAVNNEKNVVQEQPIDLIESLFGSKTSGAKPATEIAISEPTDQNTNIDVSDLLMAVADHTQSIPIKEDQISTKAVNEPEQPEEHVVRPAEPVSPEAQTQQDIINSLTDRIANLELNFTITSGTTTTNSSVKIPMPPVKDDSIIDIDTTVKPIDYSIGAKVPVWSHHYVYKASELNNATLEQKKFYAHYKASFLRGNNLDLEGNTNYGFILFYELLEAYDHQHKDLDLLERQLQSLEISCPRTKAYAKANLIHRMREAGDMEGLNRLQAPASQYPADPNYMHWRDRAQKVLKLTADESKSLEDLWISGNKFINIPVFSLELVKLYLYAIKLFHEECGRRGTTAQQQFEYVGDLIARKYYRYHLGSPNYKYEIERSRVTVSLHIFRYCENVLRDFYGYKSKLKLEIWPHPDVVAAAEERITGILENKVEMLNASIKSLDEEMAIELNSAITTRWRDQISFTAENYNKLGKEVFVAELAQLIHLNSKNPSIDIIYQESAKFLAAYDKPLALHHYLRYCHHQIQIKKAELKPITKVLQKALVLNEPQGTHFVELINQLIRNEDLHQVLEEAKLFYAPVRKKVILDPSLIKQVEAQHSGTVELLNEYLNDDEQESQPTIVPPTTIAQPIESPNPSITTYQVSLSPAQSGLIQLFAEHELVLNNSQLDTYCKSNGLMKSAVVNQINENCYDVIDDNLIETEEDQYTINSSYYQQILQP